MFVRWQTHKRGYWAAILVESVRTNGRPTQKHIAYLGAMTSSKVEITYQRAYFWQRVMKRLDRLGNRVSDEDRKRIEQAISRKVPRLTREEYDECCASWTELGLDGRPSFEVCGETHRAQC
jgi:hypothetical protein